MTRIAEGRFKPSLQQGKAVWAAALLVAAIPLLARAQGQSAPGNPGGTPAEGQSDAPATGSKAPQTQAPERDARNPQPAPRLSPRVPPITQQQRRAWIIRSTIGIQGLTAGTLSAGVGTWLDRPREYGQDWEGFGERYGMRLTGIASSNVAEAEIGSLWGEDPRYSRVPRRPFLLRLRHVVRMTFEAPRADGEIEPAYARYGAITGTNFLSNLWREPSEATTDAALERTGLGLLGRMGSNAFREFWPDVRQWFRLRR